MKRLRKKQIKAVRIIMGLNSDLRHKYTYDPRKPYTRMTKVLNLIHPELGGQEYDEPMKSQEINRWIVQILKGVEW